MDALIGKLSKCLGVIAQDVHVILGSNVGMGTADHLSARTEGYQYTMLMGTLQSWMLQQHVGVPQRTIKGVHVGAIAALPFVSCACHMERVLHPQSTTP